MSTPEALGRAAANIDEALRLLTAVAPHVRQEDRERAQRQLLAAAVAVRALQRPACLNDFAEPGPGPAPGAEPTRG